MEAEIDYAVRMIELIGTRRLASIAVRPEAQDAYREWIQKRLAKTTWNSGGCDSWYLTEDGFNATMFPGFATTFQRLLGRVDLHDYIATGAAADLAEGVGVG